MVLSDEMTSLKAEMKRLVAAVEELSLNMVADGEVELVKLSWFNSPYYSGNIAQCRTSEIPYSINDANKPQIASYVPENDATIVAHHVFDEMSQPIFCSNQCPRDSFVDGSDRMYRNDEVRAGKDDVDLHLLSSTGNYLATTQTPPRFNSTASEYDGLQFHGSILEGGSCLVDVDGGLDVGGDMLCDIIKSAYNRFDKMPILSFMLEMARGVTAHLCPKQQLKGNHLFHEMPEPILSRGHIASFVNDDGEDASVYENEELQHHRLTQNTHCLLTKALPVDIVVESETHRYDIVLQSGNLLS